MGQLAQSLLVLAIPQVDKAVRTPSRKGPMHRVEGHRLWGTVTERGQTHVHRVDHVLRPVTLEGVLARLRVFRLIEVLDGHAALDG